MVFICIPIMTLMNGFISFTDIFERGCLTMPNSMCWQTAVWAFLSLASSLFSSGGRVNLLTEIYYRVLLIITDGLSFFLMFLFQLPHSFSKDFSSAVQLWNYSSLSNSSPAPSFNPTQQWFILNLFDIQTVFGIFPTVHSQSSTWEAT